MPYTFRRNKEERYNKFKEALDEFFDDYQDVIDNIIKNMGSDDNDDKD